MKFLLCVLTFCVLFAVGITFLALNVVRKNDPTAKQANALCAPHDGIKELVAPGEDGAYVLCNDGRVERTKDPTSKGWRDDTYWPWEWVGG